MSCKKGHMSCKKGHMSCNFTTHIDTIQDGLQKRFTANNVRREIERAYVLLKNGTKGFQKSPPLRNRLVFA